MGSPSKADRILATTATPTLTGSRPLMKGSLYKFSQRFFQPEIQYFQPWWRFLLPPRIKKGNVHTKEKNWNIRERKKKFCVVFLKTVLKSSGLLIEAKCLFQFILNLTIRLKLWYFDAQQQIQPLNFYPECWCIQCCFYSLCVTDLLEPSLILFSLQ